MALTFYGPSSYATTWAPTGTTAKLNIPAIIDTYKTGTSGSISVQLWYFAAPYTGSPQQISAQFAAYSYPGTLKPGQEYKPLSVTVPVSVPNLSFNATYYVAMLLVETSGKTAATDDHQNLGSKTFTRYPGPGGDGGAADNSSGNGDSNGNTGSSDQGSETNSYTDAATQDVTTYTTEGDSGTITGGDWPCLMVLQAKSSAATSLGADTIVAQAGAATISASGTPFVFGGSGPMVFNETGSAATLVGGGAATVNAGAAGMVVFGGTGGLDFTAGSGASTLIGGGAETVRAGTAGLLVFGGAGAVSFLAGSGASTIVSGSGGGTLRGNVGATLFFGFGPTGYVAGASADTVIGYAGAMSATGGANGTVFFTGKDGGGNVLTTGTGADTIIGFGSGDQFAVTNKADNVVVTAGAATTINGAKSTGTNTFFAYAQNDVVIGGSGTTAIQSAFGNQTLTGGGGPTLYDILDSASARAILVTNFSAAKDTIVLGGYPAGAAAAALQGATFAGGSETISLTDGTRVTFQGITNLGANVFH